MMSLSHYVERLLIHRNAHRERHSVNTPIGVMAYCCWPSSELCARFMSIVNHVSWIGFSRCFRNSQFEIPHPISWFPDIPRADHLISRYPNEVSAIRNPQFPTRSPGFLVFHVLITRCPGTLMRFPQFAIRNPKFLTQSPGFLIFCLLIL